MDDTQLFGARLRQARVARDLTQEALAEQVGCSTQTVRAFESARRRPSRDMAARIADVLQITNDARADFIRIARAAPPVAAAAPPAASPLVTTAAAVTAPPHAAPIALPNDALIGRCADLQRVQQALIGDGRRLVTVLGPGGIGKTRLALQSAADLEPRFADGVAFVPLAAASTTDTIAGAIAEAVRCPIPASQSPETALLPFLRERTMLLVLDNLEHLLAPQHGTAVNMLLSNILHEAPQVRMLATSRERLRLRDEWVIELAGLVLPADDRAGTIDRSEAVVLFAERARQVDDDFALQAHNRVAVAQICRLLGGVPLGIELAASWARVLSCEEIAAEIALGTDMEALAERDLPSRHRSLHAVIEHSWQLLSPAEQHVLMGMAVFRGGGSRESVSAVLAAPAGTVHASAVPRRALLPTLAALVDKSLLRRRVDAVGGTRYDVHELVRQYAAAQLAQQPAEQAWLAGQHATHYAEWLEQQEPILKSARQKQAVLAIVSEIDNIRAAWQWACEQRDAGLLRRMFLTLDWFYEVHGWNAEGTATFAQGSAALRPLAEQPDAPKAVQTCYWMLVARDGWHALRRDPAYAVSKMSAAIPALRQIDPLGGLVHVLKGFVYLKIFGGNYAEADELLREALELADAAGNMWARGVALVIGGVMETLRADAAVAQQRLHEALAVARGVGDPRLASLTLNYLGLTALNLGALDEAERVCRECLMIAAENQDRFQMALVLQSLGRVALLRDDQAESEWLLNESLTIARAIGDRWLEAQALGCLGALAELRGSRARARQLHRSAVATAAAAPLPTALDELTALAVFEYADAPAAALTACAFVVQHPLARPAAHARAEALLRQASALQRAAAEAAVRPLLGQPPSALLPLFG